MWLPTGKEGCSFSSGWGLSFPDWFRIVTVGLASCQHSRCDSAVKLELANILHFLGWRLGDWGQSLGDNAICDITERCTQEMRIVRERNSLSTDVAKLVGDNCHIYLVISAVFKENSECEKIVWILNNPQWFNELNYWDRLINKGPQLTWNCSPWMISMSKVKQRIEGILIILWKWTSDNILTYAPKLKADIGLI